MIKHSISFGDLTGGLNNVDTMDRLNSSPRRTETPDIMNVEYFQLGGIKSMDGNTQVGDKQSSKIVGGWEYRKGNDKYMMIATLNGEVKILNQATNTFDLVYTFPHQSQRVSFTNMNNGCVFTNGIDDLVFFEKNRHTLLSGTVSVTEGLSTVTGTSTKFASELRKGDAEKRNTDIITLESGKRKSHLALINSSSLHQD